MKTESKSYSLPKETIPGLKLSDHLANLFSIREFFESRGIATQNTRIERYINYLDKVAIEGQTNESMVFKNSVDSRFRSGIDWMLYVLREVHELMWIFDGLKKHIPAGLDERLRVIVSGSDFAALDTNSHSRNVQFELRIASYFCQSGCEVDLTTNIDVIAANDDLVFYIECKRIASAGQLENRLVHAAKQLSKKMPREYKKMPTFGIVATDVTKVSFPHNGLTWGETEEHSRDINQTKLGDIVDSMRLPAMCGNRNILLYWLQIHIPCLIKHPPATITRFSSTFMDNHKFDKKALEALKVFRNIFEVSSRRDEREMPRRALIPRTSLRLPPGTQFQFVDEKILKVFREGRHNHEENYNVIAKLTFNGITHEFSLVDLEALLASISESRVERLLRDTMDSRVELVIKMYIHRYPFENIGFDGLPIDEPDQTGSDTA